MFWYGVCAYLGEREILIGEWRGELGRAESAALATYNRFHGTAAVVILRDGGSWRHVVAPPRRIRGRKPFITDAGFCAHSQCGQIPPESCYCLESEA